MDVVTSRIPAKAFSFPDLGTLSIVLPTAIGTAV